MTQELWILLFCSIAGFVIGYSKETILSFFKK